MKTKRIVTYVGIGVAALFMLGLTGVILNFYVLSPKLRPPPVIVAPTNPEAIERGRYLAHNVAACIACHSPVQESVPGEPVVDGMVGAGRDFGDLPGFPGHLRARNLTPDLETGLGGWTDGEIARAIREGVSKDGRALFPQMPYLTYRETLSDGEILDIIAYLRTLAPIKNDAGKTSIDFPVSMFIRAAPKPLEAPPPAPPTPSDKLARGRWLLRTAACHDCHDAVTDKMRKIPGKELAGGMKFPLPSGYVIAPNISSDRATGIGAYSDDDILRALVEAKGKDGRDLYFMPSAHYRGLTSEDKSALLAALRESPAVSHIVPPSKIGDAP